MERKAKETKVALFKDPSKMVSKGKKVVQSLEPKKEGQCCKKSSNHVEE